MTDTEQSAPKMESGTKKLFEYSLRKYKLNHRITMKI